MLVQQCKGPPEVSFVAVVPLFRLFSLYFLTSLSPLSLQAKSRQFWTAESCILHMSASNHRFPQQEDAMVASRKPFQAPALRRSGLNYKSAVLNIFLPKPRSSIAFMCAHWLKTAVPAPRMRVATYTCSGFNVKTIIPWRKTWSLLTAFHSYTVTSIVLLSVCIMKAVWVINTRSMAHVECDAMHNIRAAKTPATKGATKNLSLYWKVYWKYTELCTKGSSSVQYIRLIMPAWDKTI